MSHPRPLDPAIQKGSDEIVQLIHNERLIAIAATQKCYEEITIRQSHIIDKLEMSLQTYKEELEQASRSEKEMAAERDMASEALQACERNLERVTSDQKEMAVEYDRVTKALRACEKDLEKAKLSEKKTEEYNKKVGGDLKFLLRALKEMGMHLSSAYDVGQGTWLRELLVRDETWKEFFRPFVSTSDDNDSTPRDAEYPNIAMDVDEPLSAVLALQTLKDTVLQDREALASLQETYIAVKRERDDFETQIALLEKEQTT